MKIYEKILKQIKSELCKEVVECNENEISLYDLYELTNNNYLDLRNIVQNKKIFASKELFRRPSYKHLNFYCEKDRSSIAVIFGSSLYSEYFSLEKEAESREFYIKKDHCSEKKVNKFVKKYYNQITYVFSILQKYSTELYDFKLAINKYKIEYQDYVFEIYINSGGVVDFVIMLKNNIEHREIYKREYYGKDSLMKILEDSKFEIAKRVKIDINTLDNSIVEVINKSRENSSKKMVK